MEPNAPPPWLMFLIMVVLLSVTLGLMILLAGVKRVLRGESFWVPREEATLRPAGGRVRSAALKGRFKKANAVQGRSAHLNAENLQRSGVQTFTERSNVQPPAPPPGADLPASIDELQRLAHTIALYAKRPNKELAISEAWGASKGEGGLYQRASRLFDAAMSDRVRQAAKAKQSASARETEGVEV